MTEKSSTKRGVDHLLAVMAKLRDPNGGCPWDLKQNFKTVAPYTVEESYELLEAAENNDKKAIKEELGDVLFQVAFHAQMGKEAGLFDFDSVAQYAADKMVERHPHVFATRQVADDKDVLQNWETDKAAKRQAAADKEGRKLSVMDEVSLALPASQRAVKLQKRAARVGFDWDEAQDVLAKIREEIGELETEMKNGESRDRMEDELGDVFFAVTNLARKLSIDPETALRRTNQKFERRFREIEKRLSASDRTVEEASLQEMETLWNQIKREEKTA